MYILIALQKSWVFLGIPRNSAASANGSCSAKWSRSSHPDALPRGPLRPLNKSKPDDLASLMTARIYAVYFIVY